jgi:hypothetical protein
MGCTKSHPDALAAVSNLTTPIDNVSAHAAAVAQQPHPLFSSPSLLPPVHIVVFRVTLHVLNDPPGTRYRSGMLQSRRSNHGDLVPGGEGRGAGRARTVFPDFFKLADLPHASQVRGQRSLTMQDPINVHCSVNLSVCVGLTGWLIGVVCAGSRYASGLAFSPKSGYFATGNDKGSVLLYSLQHYQAA